MVTYQFCEDPMLIRSAAAFTMIAGIAFATPQSGLVKGKTTVADVEQTLGAPSDTSMRADGALTLVYSYARCAHAMPAAFPAASSGARFVALRFSPEFVYQSKSVGLATASAEPVVTTLLLK
jgi:hypothetical protein